MGLATWLLSAKPRTDARSAPEPACSGRPRPALSTGVRRMASHRERRQRKLLDKALIALAVDPVFADCAFEPLSSWPGLSRPSTPRCRKDESGIGTVDAKAYKSKVCLRALDAPNHVGGRDKPGHDALKTRPRISRILRIPRPIASAISDIRQILDFQKYRSNDLVSRKMVHSAMVASIATPIVTRTLTAVAGGVAARWLN